MTASQNHRVALNARRLSKKHVGLSRMEARQIPPVIDLPIPTGADDDDEDLPFPGVVPGPQFTRPTSSSSSTSATSPSATPSASVTESEETSAEPSRSSESSSSESATEPRESQSNTSAPPAQDTPQDTDQNSDQDTEAGAPTPTPPPSRPPTFVTRTSTEELPTGSSISQGSEDDEGGSNAGPIVGGILAAVLGIAALIFVFRFMTRRRKRRDEIQNPFDPKEFRRSAVMVHDQPGGSETMERGITPRPPSVIERKLASPAPAYGPQSGTYPQSTYTPFSDAQMQYGQVPPDYIGQQVYAVPPQPQYGNYNQMMTQSPQAVTFPVNNPYGAPAFSPLPSPTSTMVPAYDSVYKHNSQAGEKHNSGVTLIRQGSVTSSHPSIITRRTSVIANTQNQQDNTVQYANLSRASAAPMPTPVIEEEPIDPTRSSVTPFQEAQYVEISKKLNTEPPAGLNTPAAEQILATMKVKSQPANDPAAVDEELPPPPMLKDSRDTESPFADPSASIASRHASIVEFPVPPPMVNHARVNSNPPILPEISVQPRDSGYDFPTSIFEGTPTSTPLGRAFPSGVSGTLGAGGLGASTTTLGKFPITPSPLATSFTIPSPPVGKATFAEAITTGPPTPTAVSMTPATPTTPSTPLTPAIVVDNSAVKTASVAKPATVPAPAPAPASAPTPANIKRPDTVYDPEDAYGGI
ncbi:hypothetical protein AX16_001732 [Volvariella volvacea WC 439]|nr:hypothetical protein AX16_001732 [Volvariella volvacea WC 439]